LSHECQVASGIFFSLLGTRDFLSVTISLMPGRREEQKLERRERIFKAAMDLFSSTGYETTTVLDIAKAAQVSRGTVFNYYPYKEAMLIEHFASNLQDIRNHLGKQAAFDELYFIFGELAKFVEVNRHLILPLSYELLNPDPERSRKAFMSLPLTEMVYGLLTQAREQGLIRNDFSRERLSRTIANGFFLTTMQWAAYRQDLSIHDELRKTLQLILEGIVVQNVEGRI
jgi:AcrR family transcriptional regulator